jgi:hypothetical protein
MTTRASVSTSSSTLRRLPRAVRWNARRTARIGTRAASTRKPPNAMTSTKRAVSMPEIRERRALIPYFNDARERPVYVGDAARAKIAARKVEDFLALPREETSDALRALRAIVEDGWATHEREGCGHARQWPEIFVAASALIREQFPQFGVASEILPGTGWGTESEAIDWVIRRPEKHIIASKIHFATRLHRDPDSWTNPATTQRPRDGWPELSMPDRSRYQYRFINVHLTTSALDPTGNAWQSPLVVMLPRDGGAREWAFVKRKLEMTSEGAKDENNFDDKLNIFDPKTWIIRGNRLTRGAYTKESKVKDDTDTRGADGMTDAERDFEFPEVVSQDDQEFVSNGAIMFDSFDCWHGAAKWQEDKAFKKTLTDVDPKGRQPFHSARCSIEMRFRVRIDMNAAGAEKLQWGPFTSAVRDGKFLDEPLRDSEARYDLTRGRIVRAPR